MELEIGLHDRQAPVGADLQAARPKWPAWRGVACNSRGYAKASQITFTTPPGVASNAAPTTQKASAISP